MVAGCGNKCIKYFFFFINFLLFALGGIVCGLALWIRFDNNFQKKVFDVLNPGGNQSGSNVLQLDTLYIILYVIAALGLLIFILGFVGCCGSCVESVCMIGVYFTLILILFVILLVGGIYGVINKSKIKDDFVNVWRNEFVVKYNVLAPEIVRNVDNIQSQLHCCGATGCQDFVSPPLSCNCTTVAGPIVRPGCANSVYEAIDGNITIILIVGGGILVIELIAMIFACILCSALKEKSSINF